MDYVSHTDVLPYTNTDQKMPIENELFPRFFNSETEDHSKFKPSETLLAWKDKNHHWLQLSDVYKETTNNIQITAIPFFIGKKIIAIDHITISSNCFSSNVGVRYSQNTTNYWVSFNFFFLKHFVIQLFHHHHSYFLSNYFI